MINDHEFAHIARTYPILNTLPLPLKLAVKADAPRLSVPQGRMVFDMDSKCHSVVMPAELFEAVATGTHSLQDS